MVTGAAGRVMLLEDVYGLPHGRATQDVDLGVMVADWGQYHSLVERLRQDHGFVPDPTQRQRLRLREQGILDLIPFGAIESDDRVIHWPPDGDFAMNVFGFREAYTDTIDVRVDGLTVPVVGPVGLALLKLVAWNERHYTQPKKDAADLAYVLRHFGALLTERVLFDDYFAAVEAADYDADLAASRVLGRRIATLAAEDTRAYVYDLLNRELKEGIDSRLIREVVMHLPGETDERARLLLEHLRAGFIDAATS